MTRTTDDLAPYLHETPRLEFDGTVTDARNPLLPAPRISRACAAAFYAIAAALAVLIVGAAVLLTWGL